MRIDIKNIKVYLISPCSGKYIHRVHTVLDRLMEKGFTRIEIIKSVVDACVTKSLTLTNMKIMELEKNNTEPFLILEDDVNFIEFSEYIDIPDDTHALYMGVSNWIYPGSVESLFEKPCKIPIIQNNNGFIKDKSEFVVQIYGMTSAHAILYVNREYTHKFIEFMSSLLSINIPHDLLLATLHIYFKVYAMKKPMFYQDSSLGGQEEVTRLLYNGINFSK